MNVVKSNTTSKLIQIIIWLLEGLFRKQFEKLPRYYFQPTNKLTVRIRRKTETKHSRIYGFQLELQHATLFGLRPLKGVVCYIRVHANVKLLYKNKCNVYITLKLKIEILFPQYCAFALSI